ncbi:hypothetical protein GCM10010994_60720 [Chelatococcus reniformis]|uniref:Uncharacterized protein n=1 Tax=Chelatococcus reniformis TaxID=1494448 RepID=A0A916XQ39_9HYPH|nr:hypothetical protein GCM10010994_60720 [Chelatococcus reniformis]
MARGAKSPATEARATGQIGERVEPVGPTENMLELTAVAAKNVIRQFFANCHKARKPGLS